MQIGGVRGWGQGGLNMLAFCILHIITYPSLSFLGASSDGVSIDGVSSDSLYSDGVPSDGVSEGVEDGCLVSN